MAYFHSFAIKNHNHNLIWNSMCRSMLLSRNRRGEDIAGLACHPGKSEKQPLIKPDRPIQQGRSPPPAAFVLVLFAPYTPASTAQASELTSLADRCSLCLSEEPQAVWHTWLPSLYEQTMGELSRLSASVTALFCQHSEAVTAGTQPAVE